MKIKPQKIRRLVASPSSGVARRMNRSVGCRSWLRHVQCSRQHNLSNRQFHTSQTRKFELSQLLEPAHHVLQQVHSATGMPWYILIPLTTITLRSTITLPLAIANRLRARKQAELRPILGAMAPVIRARLAASPAAQEGVLTAEQVQILSTKEQRQQRVQLFRKHKCQVWKSMILLPAVQIPLFISMSMIFRAMCGWSVIPGIPVEPEFNSASFLWYQDLIVPDPYGVVPIMIGAVSMANVEWNIATMARNSSRGLAPGSDSTLSRVIANLSRIGVVFFMTASFQAPLAVCLYWVSSTSFSFLQNIFLDGFLPIGVIPQRSKQLNVVECKVIKGTILEDQCK